MSVRNDCSSSTLLPNSLESQTGDFDRVFGSGGATLFLRQISSPIMMARRLAQREIQHSCCTGADIDSLRDGGEARLAGLHTIAPDWDPG